MIAQAKLVTPIGMRGFYPSNTTLAPVGRERVRQAFANMKQLAELGGSDLASSPHCPMPLCFKVPYS